jgi:predicted dehydrogenase
MFKIALVGFGYWGPNLFRNLIGNPDCQLTYLIDSSENRLLAGEKMYPSIKVSTVLTHDILEMVDVVFIATPADTHFQLASMALTAGKHVWIEKPATSDLAELDTLCQLAESKGVKCVVDHTYVHSEPVKWIKKFLQSGKLGKVNFINSTRANLGIFQPDVSVLWDLAIHDLSIVKELLEIEHFDSVSCVQFNPINGPTDSVANMRVVSGDVPIFIHTDWLSPVKSRLFTINGSLGSLTFDDTEQFDKIKLSFFEISVNKTSDPLKNYSINPKLGQTVLPRIESREALANGIEAFFDSIRGDYSNPNSISNVVTLYNTLFQAEQSSKNNGKAIALS